MWDKLNRLQKAKGLSHSKYCINKFIPAKASENNPESKLDFETIVLVTIPKIKKTNMMINFLISRIIKESRLKTYY